MKEILKAKMANTVGGHNKWGTEKTVC